jgi:hypothetical protein
MIRSMKGELPAVPATSRTFLSGVTLPLAERRDNRPILNLIILGHKLRKQRAHPTLIRLD